MIELNDDKTLFFFDRGLDPVLTVPSGETVRIRCTLKARWQVAR